MDLCRYVMKNRCKSCIPFTVLFIYMIMISAGSQTVWIEGSFEDFRDGRFLDAGSNLYVSAKGRIQMIAPHEYLTVRFFIQNEAETAACQPQFTAYSSALRTILVFFCFFVSLHLSRRTQALQGPPEKAIVFF